MKIALVSGKNPAQIDDKRWALIEGDDVFVLESINVSDKSAFANLVDLFDSVDDQTVLTDVATRLNFGNVLLHAPVPAPEKILCIGKNYAAHAAEMGGNTPEKPVVFGMFASAITGPHCDVPIPDQTLNIDYEAELVAIIGREGRNISRDKALEHVFGYTCGNDITSRDWQKGQPGGQWLLGKSIDSFAPIGPWIVTAGDIDPTDVAIECRLNGDTMQSGHTSDMIFPLDYLIAHLSRFFTLRPGDLIFTGTPEGVGAGRTPPVFLNPGDRLEVEVAGIGTLCNRMIAGKSD